MDASTEIQKAGVFDEQDRGFQLILFADTIFRNPDVNISFKLCFCQSCLAQCSLLCCQTAGSALTSALNNRISCHP